MACNSCNQRQKQMNIVQIQDLPIDQMQNMSIDQMVDLYEQGYRIPRSDIKSSDIQSLAIKDIGTMQYIWLGLFTYGSYKSYKTKHNIWAIIFGGLALGSAGGIYTNYKK